jgi:hypothetical protein
MADAFLIPQVYNAERAGVDLAAFPTIRCIYQECNQLEESPKPLQNTSPTPHEMDSHLTPNS